MPRLGRPSEKGEAFAPWRGTQTKEREKERTMQDETEIYGVKRADGGIAHLSRRDYEQEMAEKAARNEKGRYTLEDAALLLEEQAGERCADVLMLLTDAVQAGTIPAHVPGRNAPYRPKIVRCFHEEVFADDLNAWLTAQCPRITWRFPSPKEQRGSEHAALQLRGAASTKMRARHDYIQIEIDDVIASLEQRGEYATAVKVMALLRERAGRPDSCIEAVTPEGITWTSGSTGAVKELTKRALYRRLKRPA